MKKFIREISWFIIPVIILLFILEFSLRAIPNPYKKKRNDLQENANTIEVLVFGNSHAYYGINPEYVHQNTYNAAMVSQSLDIDWKILERHSFPKLKHIIIPISYASLFVKLEHSLEPWRMNNYKMYSDLNFYPCEEYSCTELFKDKACKRVQDLGFYFNRKYEIGCDSKGFGLALKNPDSVNLVKLKKTAMEAVKRHTKVTKDSELRNTDFEELFALTHDNIKKYALKGMTIWLVTLPTTPFYAESLNSYQREKMMEAIHTMCRQNRNCHYLNLLQAPQFNLIDFHDGDHLAPRGARKLAGILDSILSKN